MAPRCDDRLVFGCEGFHRALLVAIDRQEVSTFAALIGRCEGAGIVAMAWTFNLDNFGTKITELHRAVWARNNACQVNDSNVFQGSHVALNTSSRPVP